MRVLIIGLGQMGSSLALAAKRAGHYVIGYNRSRETVEYALEMSIIDEELFDLSGAAEAKPELVVIGAALSAYPTIFSALNEVVQSNWIVTDMGSVKGSVMKLAEKTEQLKKAFIGGHPMAGAEKAGIENRAADLFIERRWFCTSFEPEVYGGTEIYREKMERLLGFLDSINANPVKVDADTHDAYVGRVSHLPQLLSVLMAASLMKNHPDGEHLNMAAGGFRDVSRLAGSSSDIWNDIMFLNKTNLLQDLREFRDLLDTSMDALEQEDDIELRKIFSAGNETRKLFLERAKELGINI